MDHSEKYSYLKNVHWFDNKLINFIGIVSVAYIIFLVFELSSKSMFFNIPLLVIIDTIVCLIFLFEFFYFLFKAKSKKEYFKRYYLEFLASLPFMLLIPLSPGLAFLNLFKIIRGLKSIIKIYSFIVKKEVSKLKIIVVIFFLIIVYFSMVLVQLEKSNNSGFSSFEDGLWWAVTTITTVGYGDKIPTTMYGKLAAMLMMILGVGITSALGAILVSSLLKPSHSKMLKEEELLLALDKDMERRQTQLELLEQNISSKIDRLEKKVDEVVKDKNKIKKRKSGENINKKVKNNKINR